MLISPPDKMTPAEFAEVTLVAGHFGLVVQSACQAAGGFSDATVCRIEVSGPRTLALRRTPASATADSSRLGALHSLLRHVDQTGLVEVPVPLRRTTADQRSHDPVFETIVRRPSGLWHVEPWLPGASCDGHRLNVVQIEHAMQVIHRFHMAAADFAARQSRDCWFALRSDASPAITRRLRLARQLADTELRQLKQAAALDVDDSFAVPARELCRVLEIVLPRLVTRLGSLARQEFTLQPVICDLWAAHILFSGDRVTGLIDLNACSTDHVAVDLTRLQRSWFGSDTRQIHAMLASFQRFRPFSTGESDLLRVLDESSVFLSPCTWLRRRYLNHQTLATSRPQVVARLRSLVNVAANFSPL